MNYTATIKTKIDEKIIKAFSSEQKTTKRSHYEIKRLKDSIIFSIKAKDATALRATLNSITRLLSVYEQVKNGSTKIGTGKNPETSAL